MLGNFAPLIRLTYILFRYFTATLRPHAIFVLTFAAFIKTQSCSLFPQPSKSPLFQYIISHTVLTLLLYPLLSLGSHQYSGLS